MIREDALQARFVPRAFARDFAVVGAVSALALASVGYVPAITVALSMVFAAFGGAAIGAATPALLHWRVRRKPLVMLLPAVFGLGACWGGGAVFLASRLTGAPWVRCTELGMTVGAIQLGFLWLPYVLCRAHSRQAWPLVALSCAAAPLAGLAAYLHVSVH